MSSASSDSTLRISWLYFHHPTTFQKLIFLMTILCSWMLFLFSVSKELASTTRVSDVLVCCHINAQGTASNGEKRETKSPLMKCVFFGLFPGKFISGIFPLLEWLALTAFPLHFVLQGLFIFLIDGVYNPEVSLLGVAQGWQSEWEKWQVSYLDNWGTKLAFHLSVLLPFMLGLAYLHPCFLLKTLAPPIKRRPHFSLALTNSLLLPEVFEFSVFNT